MKHKLFNGTAGLLVVTAAAMAVSGCARGGKTAGAPATASAAVDAAGNPVKAEDRFRVAADTADFFRFSPQQPAGADLQLKKDTRVTKLRRLGGYTQVKTADGQVGYVGSEDITQLTAQEIAAEDAALLATQAPPSALNGPGTPFTTVGGQPVGGTYVMPPEAGRTEALPVPDAAPKPTPPPPEMFRY